MPAVEITIILVMGILLFIAYAYTQIYKASGIPDVLLLVLSGLLIGPVLHLITPGQVGVAGQVFTAITIIVLLFYGGIRLRADVLAPFMKKGLLLMLLNFTATVAIVTFASCHLLGLPLESALVLGCITGGTGAAIVIPLIPQLRMTDAGRTLLFIESTLSDALCIIMARGVISSLRFGHLETASVFLIVMSSLLFAALFGVACAILWSFSLKLVRGIQGSIFLTLALAFIIYGISDMLGFSGALAVLTFGLTLGNIDWLRRTEAGSHLTAAYAPLSEAERSAFSQLVYLLKSFFFIYSGLSVELSSPATLVSGLALVALVFASRLPLTKAAIADSLPAYDSAIISAMATKGIVSSYLAPLPAAQGIAGGNVIRGTVYAMVLFSIAIASVLVFLITRGGMQKYYDAVFHRQLPSPKTHPK